MKVTDRPADRLARSSDSTLQLRQPIVRHPPARAGRDDILDSGAFHEPAGPSFLLHGRHVA